MGRLFEFSKKMYVCMHGNERYHFRRILKLELSIKAQYCC